jgi:hypothetical protein
MSANETGNETGVDTADTEEGAGGEIGMDLEVTVDSASASATNAPKHGFSDLCRAGAGYGLFLVGLASFSEGADIAWIGATAAVVAVSMFAGWLHSTEICGGVGSHCGANSWRNGAYVGAVSAVLLAGIGIGRSVAIACMCASFMLMPVVVKSQYLSRYYMLAKAGAPLCLLVSVINGGYWVTAVVLTGAVLVSCASGCVFDHLVGARVFRSIDQQNRDAVVADGEARKKFHHVAIAVSGSRSVLLVYYFNRVHGALSEQWLVALVAVVVCFGIIGEKQFNALGVAGRKRAAVWACVWTSFTAVAVASAEILQRIDPVYLVFVAAVDSVLVFPVTGSVITDIMETDPGAQAMIYKERAWDAAVTCFLCVVAFATGVAPHPFVCALTVYMYQHLDEFRGGSGMPKTSQVHACTETGDKVDSGDDNFVAVSEPDGSVSPTESDVEFEPHEDGGAQ